MLVRLCMGSSVGIEPTASVAKTLVLPLKHLTYSPKYIVIYIYTYFFVLQLERKNDIIGKYTKLFSIIYASVTILRSIFGNIADLFGALNITMFVT